MRGFAVCILFIVLGCQSAINTASPDLEAKNPLLFSVGDSTVYSDEFIMVYKKNNARLDSAFTRPDVQEYLELYINFKLKIQEAYKRGLDSTESYQQELATYTEQLKKPYLTATRITEGLIDEAYTRYLEEIRASHILIRLEENASPSDTVLAYEKISTVRTQAIERNSFDSLARMYSEDPSAKTNGGDLGYFSSMQMVYPFETVAYNTPVGEVSKIVRTRFGYHILRITEKREASGRVTVSHIMLRHSSDSLSVENQILEVHQQALGGVDWLELVQGYSEDERSKSNAGKLNAFGIGQVPISFQEAAFALQNPGDISDPIKTPYGWHILRLEEKESIPDKETLRANIERRIKQDDRALIGREYMIHRLQADWAYSENEVLARRVKEGEALDSLLSGALFTLDSREFTTNDFISYVDNTTSREEYGNNPDKVYNDFVESTVLSWEEAHLADKYPEYKMLLREYREGILYFTIMEQQIWMPASSDSSALSAYYLENQEKYRAASMAEAKVYALQDSAFARPLMEALSAKGSTETTDVLMDYSRQNSRELIPVKVTWEQDSDSPWEVIPMKPGVYKEVINDKLYIVEVIDVLDSRNRPLDEIRGLVISDYQKFLEDIWVEQLRNNFPVIRNEAGEKYVFSELVR